jgi:chromosome segregation ATPase
LLDYVIVFALGFLIAGLLGFAMLPVVWSRALRLTRRNLEIGIPISMSEVRAGQDHIRAEAAIELRKLETRYEAERERRHGYMAEAGRLTDAIRRLSADNAAKAARIRQLEEEGVGSSGRLGELEQMEAAFKAELAASKVTLALREDTLSDLRRQVDAAQIEIDGQRVEIVALKTKLGNAEDELAQKRRELTDATAGVVDRDGRIELQGSEIGRRDSQLTELQAKVSEYQAKLAAAEGKLVERSAEVQKLEASRKELETRLASLSADLRKRDAAIADREGRLAFAAGREAELNHEIARLKGGAQRTGTDVVRAPDGQRPDRMSAEAQLEIVRAERARLQAEVASLKRSAREGWATIEAENRNLRSEVARIAAEIAREASIRKGLAVPAIAGMIPANDEAGVDEGPVASDADAEKRVEAPPV